MIEVLYESDELPKAVADKLDMDHSRACVGGHWVFSIISGSDSLLTSLLVTLSDPSLSISLLGSLFTCTLSISLLASSSLFTCSSQDFPETVKLEIPEGDEKAI